MVTSRHTTAVILGASVLLAGVVWPDASRVFASHGARHAPMSLRAGDFTNGRRIPVVHEGNGGGCAGRNVPLHLSWSGVPSAARSLAVIMRDPDAGGFVHWVVYDIPASARAVGRTLPHGARQLRNSAGSLGYLGPCPPPGAAHHYRVMLYALNVFHPAAKGLVTLPSGPLPAMRGHILARATLVGTFKR